MQIGGLLLRTVRRRSLSSSSASSVLAECSSLHRSVVAPLNLSLMGPLDAREEQLFQTALPYVLLLGNHSSGKSSFVNYCLGRTIQTAGVAPTDDAFTIIAPGPSDYDRDGPALVSDPDLGFEGLRAFGPSLIHHTALKIRSGLASNSFMMVDSPGMIDSPGGVGGKSFDRGYNFQGAVRWLAERADVILLFFDPDKPGTTGETLATLTDALHGTDHKLLIVLNKADRFERIHDFARAYGALCWNLSKVIPRKDLPRIYTMCLPGASDGGALGLDDLDRSREEVVAKVFDAPSRRVDNAVTRLQDSAATLLVHARVCNALRNDARWVKARLYASTASAALAVAGLTGLVAYLSSTVASAATLSVVVVGAPAVALFHFFHARNVSNELATMLQPHSLDALFRKIYQGHKQNDDDTEATWANKVRPHLISLLGGDLLKNDPTLLPPLSPHFSKLTSIIQKDVPNLRRASAPVDFNQARLTGTLFPDSAAFKLGNEQHSSEDASTRAQ